MMLNAARAVQSGKLRVGEGDHAAHRGAQHRTDPAVSGSQQRYRHGGPEPGRSVCLDRGNSANAGLWHAAEGRPWADSAVHREANRAQHGAGGLAWGQDRLVPIFLATLAVKQQTQTIRFRSAAEMLETFGLSQGGTQYRRLL